MTRVLHCRHRLPTPETAGYCDRIDAETGEVLKSGWDALKEAAARHPDLMNNAPKQTKGIFLRKCHDCGKPTSDYRCQECWKKWRRKHGVSMDGKED